ncbi:unnamed protein product [Owenia fusiformis]|uniref:Uncharacterized protein n=1 Tax=Owenia fusiformis TaxID=6347 RepID=A0A8J1UGV1_OWEFU|nr:unnamed protein product [Owenia fusiformis]
MWNIGTMFLNILTVFLLIKYLSVCGHSDSFSSKHAGLDGMKYATLNIKSDCMRCNCVGLTADCTSRGLLSLPLDLPQNITTLMLSNNSISSLTDGQLGQTYGNLKVLDLSTNKIVVFGEHIFEGLYNLQDLRIGNNPYKPHLFHPLVYKPLQNIHKIHVAGYGDESNGRPGSRIALLNAFQGLQNSTIESITYEHITFMPFLLKSKHMKFLEHCNLKRFSLPDNRIYALESPGLKYMPQLEILDLSKNGIQGSIPARGFLIEFYFMRYLKVIKIEHNIPGMVFDLNNPIMAISEELSGNYWAVPKALEELYLTETRVDMAPYHLPYGIKLQREHRIKIIEASASFILTYIGKPIKGLVNLERFIFNDNNCIIVPEFFTCETGYFESLKVLDMANNRAKLSSKSSVHLLFRNCSQLQHIDISNNDITDIDSHAFEDTTGLEVLNLSGNKIERIMFTLTELKSLKLLNLSNNHIQTIDGHTRMDIDKLRETASKNLTIDIRQNPMICNCDSFQFIEWMQAYNSIMFEWPEVACIYINGSEVAFKDIVLPDMKWDCWKATIIPSLVSFGLVVVGMITTLYVYRRRYKIQYLALHLRALLRRNQHPDINFDFDGFLSYSSLDKDWALGHIYAHLNNEYNYNICLDDRNFMPGAYIADIIVESISKSNKIILIISQNFLRSGWCTFEMNLARGELATRGRDCLILILKEPVDVLPPELITPTLRSLLET